MPRVAECCDEESQNSDATQASSGKDAGSLNGSAIQATEDAA
jgi:hypothetical protein